MSADRELPEKRNPLIAPAHTPQLEILVERRRLGQTELTVKPGQVGTSNATQPSNLGKFDYAHLRVPLPKDLKGSGIFSMQRGGNYPEAYFLMRRSSDGYISATGMFKAAFPWASQQQEESEKAYIKSIPETAPEEVAGNVWIPPESALDLADEYSMRPWILALLDPEPIAKGTNDPAKDITSPPRFIIAGQINGASIPEPTPEPSASMSTRRRTLRSASPTKQAPPTPSGRKIATPRKSRRTTRNTREGSALATAFESAVEDNKASVEPEAVNGDRANSETVKVDIESTTEPVEGGDEITTTHVTVETPANRPELALPSDAQAYLDQAKAAINEANKLTAGRSAGRKRKAAMIEEDEDEELLDEDKLDVQPATKRVKTTELELRKEKIKRRATLGIAAGLAIGAILPTVVGTFFQAL